MIPAHLRELVQNDLTMAMCGFTSGASRPSWKQPESKFASLFTSQEEFSASEEI